MKNTQIKIFLPVIIVILGILCFKNGVVVSDKPELTQNDLLGNYATEGNNQGIINSDNNYSLNSFTTPTYSTLGIKM